MKFRLCTRYLAAVLAVVALSSCSSSDRSEEGVEQLVRSARVVETPVDVEKAVASVAELVSAVGRSHHVQGAKLGAHKVSAKTSVIVSESGNVVEELTTELDALVDADGSYRAESSNSRGYGRDAIFVADHLYLRPHVGKYHKRRPNNELEPNQILDEMTSAPGAYLALLGPFVEIASTSDETVAARSAKTAVLTLNGSPTRPTATLAHQKWRESMSTSKLAGSISLDSDTGAILAARTNATVGYTRDGRNFTMKLALTYDVTDVGSAAKVEAPADETTVATPERLREVDDRETLLEGIAPPARRAKTPGNPSGEAR